MKPIVLNLLLVLTFKAFADYPLAAGSYDSCSTPYLYTSNGIKMGLEYAPAGTFSVTINGHLTFDLFVKIRHCSINSFSVLYETGTDSIYTKIYSGGAIATLIQSPGKYTVNVNHSGWPSGPFIFYLLARTVGIEETSAESASILLSPNPVSDFITISSSTELSEIRLIDFTGKDVKRAEVHSSNIEIPVNDLEKGIYFVRVATLNKRIYLRKIIVQ